jgi:hypothetical protein
MATEGVRHLGSRDPSRKVSRSRYRQRPPGAVLEIRQQLAALGVLQARRGARSHAFHDGPVMGVDWVVRESVAAGLERSAERQDCGDEKDPGE